MKEVLRFVVTLEGTEAQMEFNQYDTDAAHALGLLELAKRYVTPHRHIAPPLKIPLLQPKRF